MARHDTHSAVDTTSNFHDAITVGNKGEIMSFTIYIISMSTMFFVALGVTAYLDHKRR